MGWGNRRSRLQAAITAWRNKIAQERAAAEAEAARIAEEKRIAAEAEAQRIADAAQAAAEAVAEQKRIAAEAAAQAAADAAQAAAEQKAQEAKAAADAAAAAAISEAETKKQEAITAAQTYVNQQMSSIEDLPDQTGHSGQFLKSNGSVADWATVDSGAGVGTSEPSGASQGQLFYNTSANAFRLYYSGQWRNIKSFKDGTSAITAGDNGYQLALDNPGMTSGTYWIKPDGATSAYQVYVDMSADDGGYDMYQCSGCTASSGANGSHSCPSGMSWVIGRSRDHWAVLLSRYGTGWMQNCGAVYKTSGGGNYTGCIMRDPSYYGSGCSGWRVQDGGRWWLRNSTHSEPNGDYSANGWLQIYGGVGPDNIGFNDGGAYSTGSNYICSTNAKP